MLVFIEQETIAPGRLTDVALVSPSLPTDGESIFVSDMPVTGVGIRVDLVKALLLGCRSTRG